jgi:hypothetical protein
MFAALPTTSPLGPLAMPASADLYAATPSADNNFDVPLPPGLTEAQVAGGALVKKTPWMLYGVIAFAVWFAMIRRP